MSDKMYNKDIMDAVVKLSIDNVKNGGGPFAAAIVRNGEIIATGCNRVTLDHDPTAHAEVSAIRKACEKLNTFELADCEIYSSCEPCPMCLSAIYWAHIPQIYFCNDHIDAKNIGFDDSFIYDEFTRKPEERKVSIMRVDNAKAIEAFRLWESKSDKTPY